MAPPHEALPNPRFVVTGTDDSDPNPLPYDSIRVTTHDGDVTWDSQNPCTYRDMLREFAYGEDPPEYDHTVLEPLQGGESYVIRVDYGPELLGTLDFRVDESGRVHAK